MKHLLVYLLIFSTLAFTQKDISKKIVIDIEPYKQLSYGAFFKLLTLKTNHPAVDFVEGFDFQWGYFYKLKVIETTLTNPPMDGSNKQYKLVKVISKEKAPIDYQFQLRTESSLYLGSGPEQESTLEKRNDSTYRYFNQINILVPKKLRKEFAEIVENNQNRTGLFRFKDTETIELLNFVSH
ncbi:MAG: DUF4377 domain-containing protein [Bacteroidales bacterium]|nr:DUF4377 domain-containing protein [Bacteroidales bacterium]